MMNVTYRWFAAVAAFVTMAAGGIGVVSGPRVNAQTTPSTAQPPPPGSGRGGATFGNGRLAFDVMPPRLFREEWQQHPSALGVPTSPLKTAEKYYLLTQAAVTVPSLELKVYGADAKNVTIYRHESRLDLWTGLVSSPIGILVRDRTGLMDLTGQARVRAVLRTGPLHLLHPAVRLADGTLLVGDVGIDTHGRFTQVDTFFEIQKWYGLDPITLAVKLLVPKVDLTRVDEVGYVDLASAGGGHGTTGWSNVSTFEVYAKTTAR
jgi:hypothetical protein